MDYLDNLDTMLNGIQDDSNVDNKDKDKKKKSKSLDPIILSTTDSSKSSNTNKDTDLDYLSDLDDKLGYKSTESESKPIQDYQFNKAPSITESDTKDDLSYLSNLDADIAAPKVSNIDLENEANFTEVSKGGNETTSREVVIDNNTPQANFEFDSDYKDAGFAARAALNADIVADKVTSGIGNAPIISGVGLFNKIVGNEYEKRPEFKPTKVDPDAKGKAINFVIDTTKAQQDGRVLSEDDIVDGFLSALNPALIQVNNRYKAETGRNIIQPVGLDFQQLSDTKLGVSVRPEKSAIDIINAYAKGGLSAAKAKAAEISEQRMERNKEYAELDSRIKEYEKKHPYLTAVRAGVRDTVIGNANLVLNAQSLWNATEVALTNGYDSKEYRDLINKEIKQRSFLDEASKDTPEVKGFLPNLIRGGTSAVTSLPKYYLATPLGPYGLPVMVYLENLHKGNREAAQEALPMAILVGLTGGLEKFIKGEGPLKTPSAEGFPEGNFRIVNKGTLSNTVGTKGIARQLETEGAELFTNKSNFIGGPGPLSALNPFSNGVVVDSFGNKTSITTIRNLVYSGKTIETSTVSPLARQLIVRGFQGITNMGLGSLSPEGRTVEGAFSNLIVGISLPVGKGGNKEFINDKVSSNSKAAIGEVYLPETNEYKPLLLNPADIRYNISLEPNKTLTNQIGEGIIATPNERLGGQDIGYKYESGFEAKTTPATIRLDLDTANLHLLELKRALADRTFVNVNDSVSNTIKKENAIKEAIKVLEQAIPEEVKDFFKVNEPFIREANRLSEANFLKARRKAIEEGIREENPKVKGSNKTSEDAKKAIETAPKAVSSSTLLREALDYYGDTGSRNKYTKQDKAYIKRNTLTKAPSTKQLNEGLTSTTKWMAEKAGDLTYIAAFHIEDFYRRQIQPSLDQFTNRLRNDFGELVDKIGANGIREIYQRGMDYYNSNNADPFFSALKQDALEKLPNKFDGKQARNILGQEKFKEEYKWVDIESFLKDKDGKISKQDLIDWINNNQIRVEEVLKGTSLANQMTDTEWTELGELNDKLNFNRQLSVEDTARWEYLKNKSTYQPTQYGLKDYTGEQLELEGGENYKELLLISPIKRVESKVSYEDLVKKAAWLARQEVRSNLRNYSDYEQIRYLGEVSPNTKPSGYDLNEYSKYTDQEIIEATSIGTRNEYLDYAAREFGYADFSYWQVGDKGDTYKGPHWTEENVLAHIRFNERIDSEGKRVLFIEEIQSDWNQSGRSQGYYNPETKSKLESRVAELSNKYDDANSRRKTQLAKITSNENFEYKTGRSLDSYIIEDYINRYKEQREELFYEGRSTKAIEKLINDLESYKENLRETRALSDEVSEAKIELDKQNRSDRIPENPFMGNNWKELAIKRILRYAAENGFDGVSLTSASVQRERYNRAYQIVANPDGTYDFNLGHYKNAQFIKDVNFDSRLSISKEELSKYINNEAINNLNPNIKIRTVSGKEAATTLKIKYLDYDNLYPQIMKKIGKRFGARISEIEIEIGVTYKTTTLSRNQAERAFRNGEDVYGIDENNNRILIQDEYDFNNYEKFGRFEGVENAKKEKVPSIDITPSMKTSLTKEGQPLYGTSGLEPIRPNQPIGIRNRIVTSEMFDRARQSLISEISKESDSSGTVFNSGLNPDAFMVQFKLLYKGYNDFKSFLGDIVYTYGDKIIPYAESLWREVKDIKNDFKSSYQVMIDDISNASTKPAFTNRPEERGMLGLNYVPKFVAGFPEGKKLLFGKYKRIPRDMELNIARATYLAQKYPEFGKVWNSFRESQGLLNSYSSVIQRTFEGIESAYNVDKEKVASATYESNESQRVFTDNELVSKGFNSNEISVYRDIRKAQDLILKVRETQKLYREYERLGNSTIGTPAYADAIKNIARIRTHFQKLRDEGYISLQRKGRFAVYGENPALPITDPKHKFYFQTDSTIEAGNIVKEWKDKGFVNVDSYDTKDTKQFNNLAKAVTPAMFEDIVLTSGADPLDANIEAVRKEIYGNYATTSYELHRNYNPGYKVDYNTLKRTLGIQLDAFKKSFYGDVAKQEAIKELDNSGVAASDPALANYARQYIDDETKALVLGPLGKLAAGTRKFTYFMALGYDFSQFVLNAFSQPASMTYSYFSRVTDINGKNALKGVEPEKYFVRSSKLTTQALKEFMLNRPSLLPNDFRDFYKKAIDEHVVTSEFTASLVDTVTPETFGEPNKLKRIGRNLTDDWATFFQRNGERVTRTQVFSEAYLVGKEKLGLSGNDLYKFMRESVDATQGHFSKGENPRIFRSEVGKLFYQFSSYGQIWFENLALSMQADSKQNRLGLPLKKGLRVGPSAIRHLAPVLLMSGISGMPLSNFARTVWNFFFDDDPRKYVDSLFGSHTILKNLALYGITNNAGVSAKLGVRAPILDSTEQMLNDEYDTTRLLPVLGVAKQVGTGLYDLVVRGDRARGFEGVSPRAVRNIIRAGRFSKEGVKKRGGDVIVGKSKVGLGSNILQGLGVTPAPIIEAYDKEGFERVRTTGKKIRKGVRKQFRRLTK